MELNKIAGAVLLVLLIAMVTSKIGDIAVPAYHAPHASGDDHGAATTPTKPEPEPTFAVAINNATDAQGKTQSAKCSACHTFEKGGPNRVGPNLWGVLGRKKGAHEGFDYSSGMKAMGGVWTMEDLYHFLKQPAAIVKGTKMGFAMPRADQRGAIIRFLRTLSDNPEPLPKVEPAGDKKPDEKKADDKAAPKKDEVKKDEVKKDAPAKDAPKKDEPKKDQ